MVFRVDGPQSLGAFGLMAKVGIHGERRGAARAEDAQGTPAQSHISPSILGYEENRVD